MTGTIVDDDTSMADDAYDFVVRLDERSQYGHDCLGKTPRGFGRYAKSEHLEPITPRDAFKIGDKVRFTEKCSCAWWFGPHTEVKTGTITNTDFDEKYKYDVKTDGAGVSVYGVNAEHIELIAQKPAAEPKFKVGDRVMLIEDNGGKDFGTQGERGAVLSIHDEDYLRVDFDDAGAWATMTSRLVASTANAPTPVPEFKEGDFVRILASWAFEDDQIATVAAVFTADSDNHEPHYSVTLCNDPEETTTYNESELASWIPVRGDVVVVTDDEVFHDDVNVGNIGVVVGNDDDDVEISIGVRRETVLQFCAAKDIAPFCMPA